MQSVVKLSSTAGLTPSTDDLDGWVVTAGSPKMKTWVLHTSAAGDMMSGIWECTKGSYHATYTAYEYVVLIAGKGHETGQTIKGQVFPFDDVEQASIAVAALDGVI